MTSREPHAHEVRIDTDHEWLGADLFLPPHARGIVIFVHGSGSTRRSTRNRQVAQMLNDFNLATLLFDLLTPDEFAFDQETAQFRFDIDLLTRRLTSAVDWVAEQPLTSHLAIGLFGASTGAAAALCTAADRPDRVAAVVSRGGRPDLAEDALSRVRAPTLLIVGQNDPQVIELNQQAAAQLGCKHSTLIIPSATHLFEEPGALEQVALAASHWFTQHLTIAPPVAASDAQHGP